MSEQAIAIIVNMIIVIPFSCLLFILGWKLFGLYSLEKQLALYKKNPSKATWFEKYFLGWGLMNGWTTEQSVKIMGDRLMTGWYRLCGVFFMIMAISGIVMPLILFIKAI